MFNQGAQNQLTQNSLRANILLQTPPSFNGGGCGANFLGKTNLFQLASPALYNNSCESLKHQQ
jgi:hypothetical protein